MKIFDSSLRVLVTGGAGFIGSHLVDHLVQRGCQVVVLDNFRNGKRENLATALATGRVEIIAGDVTDPTACAQAMRGVAAVFHLACLGVRHSLHSPRENHEVNALGTLLLLQAARQAGVARFLYMSTSEVYGRARAFPLTEQTATWPTTVYSASKLAGEHYTSVFAEQHGLPVVRVRPFNNYGSRAHSQGDSGEVIPRFILRALAGLPPVVFGNGGNTRDFLFVEDCADALVQIAECDALVGDLVNLGYGEETRIDALARLVLAAVERPDLDVIFAEERPCDVPRLWVDSTKLRNTIAWRPETPLARGLTKTVEHYRALSAADPGAFAQFQIRNWETAKA